MQLLHACKRSSTALLRQCIVHQHCLERQGRLRGWMQELLTSCTLHFPLQRSAVALPVAFARATTSFNGLVLAFVVVMPPWPKGRMFPPRI